MDTFRSRLIGTALGLVGVTLVISCATVSSEQRMPSQYVGGGGDAVQNAFVTSSRKGLSILFSHPEIVDGEKNVRNLKRTVDEVAVFSADSEIVMTADIPPADEGSDTNLTKLKTYFAIMAAGRSSNRDMPTIILNMHHEELLGKLASSAFFGSLVKAKGINPTSVNKSNLQAAYANWLYAGMLQAGFTEDTRLEIFYATLKHATTSAK